MAGLIHSTQVYDLGSWLLSHLDAPQQGALFAILDGTTDNPLIRHFFHHAGDAEYQPLFLYTAYQQCFPRSPYLVQFNQHHSHYLQACADVSLYGDAIWFTSPLSIKELAQQWRQLTEIVLPNGKTVVFRYWSGNILQRYLSSTPNQEQPTLPVSIDLLLTPLGNGCGWEQLNLAPVVPGTSMDGHKIKLTPQQIEVFEDAALQISKQSITDRLWRLCPQVLQQLHPLAITQWVGNGIQSANTKAITNEASVAKFVHCQLVLHPEFWRHEQLINLWGCVDSEARFDTFYELNFGGKAGDMDRPE